MQEKVRHLPSSFTFSDRDYAAICAAPATPGQLRLRTEYARSGCVGARFDNRMARAGEAGKAGAEPRA